MLRLRALSEGGKLRGKIQAALSFLRLTFLSSFPAPYFPFVRLRLSCAAFGDRPGHKCNPFMINEVAIAMTFPLSPPVRWGWGETLQKKKKKNSSTNIHSTPFRGSDNRLNSQNRFF